MGHRARMILLKQELEHVRKNIRCMEKEYERVDSWRMKAFKCANESREQNEVVPSKFFSLSIYFVK